MCTFMPAMQVRTHSICVIVLGDIKLHQKEDKLKLPHVFINDLLLGSRVIGLNVNDLISCL